MSLRTKQQMAPMEQNPHRRTGRVALRALLIGAFGLGVSWALPLDTAFAQGAPAAAPAAAAPGQEAAKEPKQVISEMVDQAFAVLRDKALKAQPALRVKKLREITDQVMDWDAMARSSLGHAWRNLNDAQRTQFVDVFKELLARQYRDDIDRFRGTERVTLGDNQVSGELVTVKTTLTTAGNEKVPINYTLHKVGNKWLVEDLSVEGVSMTNHYRKTFERFLVNDSFDALLVKLKQKLGR
jgi:phospholipid transport system substrate-binding protein